MTVGSFGVSKARPEALTYTYYGPLHRHAAAAHAVRTASPSTTFYPAVNGQMPYGGHGPFHTAQPLRNITWVHPMREGFQQSYAMAATFGQDDDFYAMMRRTWREVYPRLKDRLFDVDNDLLYHNIMKFTLR